MSISLRKHCVAFLTGGVRSRSSVLHRDFLKCARAKLLVIYTPVCWPFGGGRKRWLRYIHSKRLKKGGRSYDPRACSSSFWQYHGTYVADILRHAEDLASLV
jgi:hypothetical protein